MYENEFLSFQGSYGEKLSGKLEMEAVPVSNRMDGRGTSNLQSSFGKLKKEELDMTELQQDSSDRLDYFLLVVSKVVGLSLNCR